VKADRRAGEIEDRRRAKVARALIALGWLMERPDASGWELKGMSIRGPREGSADFLITLRALDPEGAPQVAFCGGSCIDDAVVNLQQRLDNGSLKWRPDEFGR